MHLAGEVITLDCTRDPHAMTDPTPVSVLIAEQTEEEEVHRRTTELQTVQEHRYGEGLRLRTHVEDSVCYGPRERLTKKFFDACQRQRGRGILASR